MLVVQPPARGHQQEEGEQGEGECGHLVVVCVSSSQRPGMYLFYLEIDTRDSRCRYPMLYLSSEEMRTMKNIYFI